MKEQNSNSKLEGALHWQQARLDLSEEYSEPPIILKVDDSIICTLGNFSASAGKEKSKKTFNVSALTASLLSGKQVLNYTPMPLIGRNKVLYIDTEQSNFHCKKVARRILYLAGLEEVDFSERLIFLALRRYSPEERINLIEQAIYDNSDIFLVIIDGLRDLVLDINNATEATIIMSKLQKWTDECNIHIHNVLHLNKGDDNTRGHLGTELNNKAETILQITKSIEDKHVSTVSSRTIRDIDFDDFAFCINVDGLPELLENYTSSSSVNKAFTYDELSEEEHRTALGLVFEAEAQLGYGELIDKLQICYKEATGIALGVGKTKKLKVFLSNKRMIVQVGKKYEFNKDFYY